jgi:hypothetical protein
LRDTEINDTPEKPFKTTVNVTYGLKLEPQEASSIKLDLDEYREPNISWVPIRDMETFLAIADGYHFNPFFDRSTKKYLKFQDKVGKLPIIQRLNEGILKYVNKGKSEVATTWRLPRYDLSGTKLEHLDINPFDDEYMPLYLVLGQFLQQNYSR